MRSKVDEMIESARAWFRDKFDNWDGEGAKRVLPETFERASSIVKLVETYLNGAHADIMERVRLDPGIDGKIFLKWETKAISILVDVPEDASEPFAYSAGNEPLGEVAGAKTSKGRVAAAEDAARMIAFLIGFLR